MNKKKIIIIGAGVSGLYLAYLLQNTYEVTVLEARDRLGGRICNLGGHDMGPSWIWSHHTHILELIQELDLELFRQYNKGYALYDAKEKVELFNPQKSAPAFRMQGSLNKLVDTLYQKLDFTKVLFSHEVLKIQENENTVVTTSKLKSFHSDYVISTLAPRLAISIQYEPALGDELKEKMLQTQTWMGNSMKCVVEFESAFWRDRGLSGSMFSNLGPVGEMHDACTQEKAALFGFVHSNASLESFEEDVKKQLMRVFGIEKEEILRVYFIDWKHEQFSSSAEDSKPLSVHPQYGIDTSSYSEKIYFSSTEFSFEEGGYLEGAIINAQKIAQKLLKSKTFKL
jgi:monoamine oxidase